MKNRKIVFTALNTAELLTDELPESIPAGHALLRTVCSAVSAGTERDNLRAEPNVAGRFPCQLGYSASAVVEAVGEGVKSVNPGDRVIVTFGTHSEYTVMPEKNLIRIPEGVSMEEAALLTIASFPAEGVRKTRLEFGESAMVMGLGILGLTAVQLCRIAGAVPVVACDPNPKRRELALSLGADAALDPTAPDFFKEISRISGKDGCDVCVDVAGRAEATITGLRAVTWLGRMSLLGCTRYPAEYDFYKLIHSRGIQIFGAHTLARPENDSRPGNWTHRDDITALLRLTAGGRLNMKALIGEIHSPEDAPEVYTRLCTGSDFPIGVLFDWRQLQ